MKKGSKLFSVLKNRCPQCAEAPFFESDNILKLKMNKNCPNCGLNNEHEPGFYLGAMYVSYILAVGVALSTGLILYYGFKSDFTTILFFIAGMVISTSTINFRLSRLIWINIWINYKPELMSKKKHGATSV